MEGWNERMGLGNHTYLLLRGKEEEKSKSLASGYGLEVKGPEGVGFGWGGYH